MGGQQAAPTSQRGLPLEEMEISLGQRASEQFFSEDGEVAGGLTFSPLLCHHYLYNT